ADAVFIVIAEALHRAAMAVVAFGHAPETVILPAFQQVAR
ncbi:hypothetical protein SAMN02927897_04694, partial [Kosakonia sacchari]